MLCKEMKKTVLEGDLEIVNFKFSGLDIEHVC